jgi:tetratricopeptide (TPR) repeat protein
MRSLFLVALSALLSLPSLAQDAPAAPATPPADAAAPAPTPPPVVDPLQEARDLVEVAANTKENLKKAIGIYEAKLNDESLPAKVRADGWADVSRAYLRLGDLETANATKLANYEKGQAAGKKGTAIDAKHTDAQFWAVANMACVGRTNGVMNSLFMLGDLKKGLNAILAINPRHSYARQTLGEIDHSVPGIAGGSDSRAEETYLSIMKSDPRFTPTMVNLAKFYKDKGDKAKAKEWAQKAVAASNSSVPNDWRKFDKKEAQKVLKELE